jgi:uncharacterized protein (TIGR00730 family)
MSSSSTTDVKVSSSEVVEKKQFAICVFCGSRTGNGEAFKNAATELGAELVKRNVHLVYGGGNIGLMGEIATTVNKTGKVTGVIPAALAPREVSGQSEHIQNQIIVPTMHIRKKMMADLSDAFIAMPGGLGTMEELAEMLTWTQLGIHRKPIGLLNVNGFYDPYLAMVDNMITHGFTDAKWKDALVVADNAADLLDAIEAAQVPESEISGWFTTDEA